jgi:site-specific recombinase XerD
MSSLPVPRAGADLQDNERLTARNALTDALNSARDYALADKADATRHAYRADFADFAAWCETVERSPLPAEASTVAGYLATLAERRLKSSTIRRRLAAIRHAHKLKGHEAPTAHASVQAVHQGIRRRLGARVTQKAPATAKAIAAMIRKAPVDTLAGKRDRALLLIGFSGALRRSELVALNVEDIETAAAGILLHIRRSKTDQDGRGETVAIPRGRRLMPVDALTEWLAAANLSSGPLFIRVGKGDRLTGERLTPQSVALIVKKYAKAARLDASEFSGHSLRAGLVTEALSHGADVFAVADQGRWRKLETVREYDRRAKAFSSNVGRAFL